MSTESEVREYARRYHRLLLHLRAFSNQWLDSQMKAADVTNALEIFRTLLPVICEIFESPYAFVGQYLEPNYNLVEVYLYDKEKASGVNEKWLCDGALEYIRKSSEQRPFNDNRKETIGITLWDVGIRNLLACRIDLPPDFFIFGVGEASSKPADSIREDKYDSYCQATLEAIIGLMLTGMIGIRSTINRTIKENLNNIRESNSRCAIYDAALKSLRSQFEMEQLVGIKNAIIRKEYDHDATDYVDTVTSIFNHSPIEEVARDLPDSLSDVFPMPVENILKLSGEHNDPLELEVADESIQTRLALARAYLWIADKSVDDKKDAIPFLKEIPRVYSGGGDYSQAFKILAETALSSVSTEDAAIQHSSLRTLWLWIYLKSVREFAVPSTHIETTIRDINAIYQQIKEPTIRALWTALAKSSDPGTGFPKIDSEWLYLWFGAQLLGESKMNEFYQDVRNGTMEILRCFRFLSTYMLYQIHCLRFPESAKRISFTDVKGSPDSETIESKLFLISQFAHIYAGVDRQIRLHSHLQELFSPELLLYATSESYRDHLFHVIDVCLIGYLLLKLNEQSHWLIRFRNDLDRKQCERNWFIVALLHDIGYRLKLSEKLTEILEPLSSPELEKYKKALANGLSNANRDFDSCINEKKQQYCSVKDCVPEGSSATDHGAVSWTHVRNLLESMKRGKTFVEEMDAALCAIFKHSSPFEIDAEKEPIAFLLLLCDKLQEWGRPRLEIASLTRTIAAAMHYSGLARFNLRKSVTCLQINVTLDANKRQLDLKGKDLNFILYYEPAKHTTIEPAVIWAELSFDFKRVRFPSKMPLISIKCVHPFSCDDATKWQPTELELMQEFALNDPEGVCLSGWIESINDGVHGVRYCYIRTPEEKEQLKLELQKLPSLDTLTKLPSKFYNIYSTWKEKELRKFSS